MSLIGTVARRPRNASPVPYTRTGSGGFFSGLFSRNSLSQQMEAYGTVGTLYGVVSAIATAAAKEEWWLERRSVSSRVYGPEQVKTRQILAHPAIQLWEHPNDHMSRPELVELWATHLMLTGEAYGVLNIVGGLPIEMWPVTPDRMTPVPSRRDFLAGWVYSGPEGETIPLRPEQVIQIKLPNPGDLYRGRGPVPALLADLDSVRYSAEYNRRFFLNDASPGGVIETPEMLTDDQFAQMRDHWYEQHRGVSNAHRVAILERAKWVPTAVTQRDMQFVEARGVARDAIREAYRVHKIMLGQSDDVNRASALAAADQMAEFVVEPTLTRFRGALNNRLLPLYGRPVQTQFCFSSPVKGDRAEEDASLASRVNSFKVLLDAGVDPLEAAELCGLPPLTVTNTPAVESAPAQPELEEVVPS